MEDNNLIIICPHCKEFVIIEKINCAIFRHGTFRINGLQINPHASKNICDSYIRENLIYGCGKPFRVFFINNVLHSEICDYI